MMNLPIFGLIPFCVMGVTDEVRSLLEQSPSTQEPNQPDEPVPRRRHRPYFPTIFGKSRKDTKAIEDVPALLVDDSQPAAPGTFRPSLRSIFTKERDTRVAEKDVSALPVEHGESEGLLTRMDEPRCEPVEEEAGVPHDFDKSIRVHTFGERSLFQKTHQPRRPFDESIQDPTSNDPRFPFPEKLVNPTWNPHQITVRFDYQSGPETMSEKTVEIPQILWEVWTGERLIKELYPGEAFVRDLVILTMGPDHDRFKHNAFFNSDRLQLDTKLSEQGLRPNQILHGMIQPKDVDLFRTCVREMEANKKSKTLGQRMKILKKIGCGLDTLSRMKEDRGRIKLCQDKRCETGSGCCKCVRLVKRDDFVVASICQ